MSKANPAPSKPTKTPSWPTKKYLYSFLTDDEIAEYTGDDAYYEMFSYLDPKDYPKTFADALCICESEPFYAELVYLRHWNATLYDGPNKNGLTSIDHEVIINDDGYFGGVILRLSYIDPITGISSSASIRYTINPGFGGSPEVHIIDENDSIIYWRGVDCNVMDWVINGMAGDPKYINAKGKMAFTGDHTNI